MVVSPLKEHLRSQMKEVRARFWNTLSEAEQKAVEEQLIENFFTFKGVQGALVFGVYYAIGGEAPTLSLIQTLVSQGKTVGLPCLGDGEGKEMVFRRWIQGDPLNANTFLIPEPLETKPLLNPTVFIIPLLAFDRRGGRLGYGKGHYDRLLASKPQNLKIGWAYGFQEVQEIPREDHDISLDVIVTEEGIHYCSSVVAKNNF